MKRKKYTLTALLLFVILVFSSGCSKRDYGEKYNYETDCQHSYFNRKNDWKKIQSDGDGQYILKNRYIYYYNNEKGTMTPLCNKANCLHDMESDENRLEDCNAYAPVDPKYIQYYEGYVYYFFNDWEDCSLYRVSKDGSKKDKILTTDDMMPIYNWLIHRGYFYYSINVYYYGEDKVNQVYEKSILKSLELSSNMKEKDAKVIFESDEEHSSFGLDQLQAYKNYLYYDITSNTKDFELTTTEAWFEQLYGKSYLYNIETGESNEILLPKGYSDTTRIAYVAFLEDKMLLKLYDNLEGNEYKLPIYSVNYDLTDQKIWLDGVEQGKLVQTVDNYAVISDPLLHYETIITEEGIYDRVLKDDKPCINVEIYSADAKRVSHFVYPMNVGSNFNGFGPDGVNVEFEENGDSWSVYQLNFKDVLNCHGEEVQLEKVSTRRYGALNKED